MELAKLRRDVAGRENGVWIDDLENELPALAGLKVLTRGWTSHPVRRRLAEMQATRTDEDRANTYTLAERQRKEDNAALGEAILGWEGVFEDGEEVAFSKDRLEAFLVDERYEEFRSALRIASFKASQRLETDRKAREKNSGTGSAGDSPAT